VRAAAAPAANALPAIAEANSATTISGARCARATPMRPLMTHPVKF